MVLAIGSFDAKIHRSHSLSPLAQSGHIPAGRAKSWRAPDLSCPLEQGEETGTMDPVQAARQRTLLARALVAPLLPQPRASPHPLGCAGSRWSRGVAGIPVSPRTDPLPAHCKQESETCCSERQANGSASGGGKSLGSISKVSSGLCLLNKVTK